MKNLTAACLLFLLAAAAACPARAATSAEISQFQETQRQKRTALEAGLKEREKNNRLKQAEAVRKFQAARVSLKAAADADLAGLSLSAQPARIERLRIDAASVNKQEKDAMKPFEEENQKIRAERERYKQEFIKKVIELNG